MLGRSNLLPQHTVDRSMWILNPFSMRQAPAVAHQPYVELTFMNLGDAPDDERNSKVEVPG